MQQVIIEKYKKNDEIILYQLIKKVYDEFVAPDYNSDGNNTFYDFIKPDNIRKRQTQDSLIFIAKYIEQYVGMIEIKNYEHICLLFVDKIFHHKGIAKRLFSFTIKTCLKKAPHMKFIDVHASPFSVPIYTKLGFKQTDNLKEENGIKYVPMIYNLE